MEFVTSGLKQLDLVLDAAEERGIHQISRVQIGRKHQQHIEGQGEVRPGELQGRLEVRPADRRLAESAGRGQEVTSGSR